jgi:hypothetical protein
MDKKLYNLRGKQSLEDEYSDVHNILFALSRMKTDKLREIASDPDIIKISGKSNPIIRS